MADTHNLLAEWALNRVEQLGASYGDARVVESRDRYVSTKNGAVGQGNLSESLGIGIRVIADGAWGFASTDRLAREEVEQAATEAVRIAPASATVKKLDVALVPVQKFVVECVTPAAQQ